MEKLEKIKQLYQLKKEVEKSDNIILKKQINEVIKKVYQDQYVLSFVGHFSSGKSSLINHLFQTQILPSSPVPTTSNTAQIVMDEKNFILVNLENNTYTNVEKYEDVKTLNTLNHDIDAIEIHRSTPFEIGTVIQDTPGVDATFKNHENSTLKYLLISDVVFYTVEYNHIHSEKNFEQLKLLNDLGVKVYLIVNQIDKHNETELPFDTLHQSILENLNRYDITIEQLFYSTIYDSEYNQFEAIKSLIQSLSQNKDGKAQFFDRIIQYITKSQTAYLTQKKQTLLHQLDIEENEFESAYQLHQKQQYLHNEQALLTHENNESLLLEEVSKTIKNAYLMPFELREKIQAMLTSYSTQFKVPGLFNKAQKKKQIQATLCENVLSHLNGLIDKEIVFQLNQYFMNFEKYIDGNMDAIQYNVSQDDLEAVMVEQATISKDYVLVYSDKLKQRIEQEIKQYMRLFIQKFIKMINMTKLNNTDRDDSEDLYEQYIFVNKLLTSINTNNFEHYYIHVNESIDKLIDRQYVTLQIEQPLNPTTQQKRQNDKNIQSLNTEKTVATIDAFDNMPYFNSMVHALKMDLTRIENNITKIVVFGAFSAGKSALINALLNEPLLTSSPNPTTAAITEIHYGDQHFVTFKTKDTIMNDLNRIAQGKATTIENWLKENQNSKKHLEAAHKNYVEAIENHFETYKSYLESGERVQIVPSDIKKYSAEDQHAAFVHKLEIGSLNPLLRQVVITDSPGTGSTNSRHTKETTEIIADSDLLIYVSYYNHVFTEKDKAFLNYLNQVEVINENSQSFYVINAIDLRKDDAELNIVMDYLQSELSKLQIHDAIYPVSSKTALTQNEPYFEAFRKDVLTYVNEMSHQQKIKQIQLKTDNLLNQAEEMVQHYSAYVDKVDKRNAQYAKWEASGVLQNQLVENTKRHLIDYMNELLIYLQDKMRIQLYDVIKSEVNTSQTIDKIHQNFIESIQLKLSEEFILTIPRLNKYMIQYINDANAIIAQKLVQNELYRDIQFEQLYLNQQHLSFNDAIQMMNEMQLPTISKKTLLNEKLYQKLVDQIHESAMHRIKTSIHRFQTIITNEINASTIILETYVKDTNQLLFEDMKEIKSHTLDESMISDITQALNEVNSYKR